MAAAQTDMEEMAQWRENFLATMLRYAFICGAVVAVPSIWVALREGKLAVIAVDVPALLWLFTLWRLRT
ncbi:MAG: hypothetical protein EOP39_29950, partial [Rubrivivax sp.]